MKVKEAIEKLQQLDPDMELYRPDEYWGEPCYEVYEITVDDYKSFPSPKSEIVKKVVLIK